MLRNLGEPAAWEAWGLSSESAVQAGRNQLKKLYKSMWAPQDSLLLLAVLLVLQAGALDCNLALHRACQ